MLAWRIAKFSADSGESPSLAEDKKANTLPYKVLIPTPRSWPSIGSLEQHVHQLAKALTAQGAEVTVVSQSDGRTETTKMVEGVVYHHFPTVIKGNRDIFSRDFVNYVVNSAPHYDIVHLHDLHKPLASVLLSKLKEAPVKVVVTSRYHGAGRTKIEKLAHIVYQPILSKYLQRADAIIAVSAKENHSLHYWFPGMYKKVVIIPNGVVPPKAAEKFEVGTKVILSIGRLEAHKNTKQLILAVPNDVQLVIIGEGPEEKKLKELAKDKPNVVFAGKVTDEVLSRWWNTADLYVNLSEHEDYGLTMAESISSGTPVLASNLPAHSYIHGLAGKSSLLQFRDSKVDLRTQLRSMLAETREDNKGAFYSWDKVATKTLDLYKTLLETSESEILEEENSKQDELSIVQKS